MLLNFLSLFLTINVTLSLLTLRGPYNHTAVVQDNVTLSCKLLKDGETIVNFHEVGEPYRLVWNFTGVGETEPRTIHEVYSNGLALPTSSVKYNNTHYQSDFDTSLHILNITFSDAGTYSCSLNNENKAFELYVIEKPYCHNYNSSVVVNQQAYFDCSVNFHGNNRPEVSWKHGNRGLNFSVDFENETYTLARMSLNASEEDDGKVFICHVTFPYVHNGFICQALPKLKVYFPVKETDIILSPYKKVYEEGSNIILRCVAIGEPHPHYTWTFTPLSDPLNESVRSTHPAYKIVNAHRNDIGNYTCIVHNEINHTKYTDTKIVFLNIVENKVTTVKPKYRMMPKPMEDKGDGDINFNAYAVGAVVSSLLAILLIVVFILLAIKFRARERKYREGMSLVQDDFTDDQELLDEDMITPNGGNEEAQGQYRRLGQYWEIPKRDVRLMDLIATGSYCEVWRGRMRKHSDSTDVLRVAIKKMLDDASEVGRKFFLAEMEVMKTLKAHSNVITLIGCYTLTEPWMLMLEYAHEGTLHKYLQKHRPGSHRVEIQSQEMVRLKNNKIDAKKLLSLASQVISGLLHLTKYKLLYYQLSVSSVLVAKGGVCKLSGFMFQKEITERNLYEKESLPVRCMAPESLSENIFDTKTDTYAFGILLWQIIHFGLRPYPSMDIDEVKEKVLSGYRMSQPQHCSSELFAIMERCWSVNPDERPLYPDILQALSVLQINSDANIVLEDLPILSTSEGETETEHNP
ncbi:fibroblast growth factor receptor homolog 1-like [Saccostrea echinata]|uniref:fibroblast growth factor receptor homolog 1-like n=1 Tax=Saccostrea echinata TaxID=191078 RepID=UPI002A7F3677|nr:fibroblast growth factor receptor homolog 1-like [Saccostrea echinata]